MIYHSAMTAFVSISHNISITNLKLIWQTHQQLSPRDSMMLHADLKALDALETAKTLHASLAAMSSADITSPQVSSRLCRQTSFYCPFPCNSTTRDWA